MQNLRFDDEKVRGWETALLKGDAASPYATRRERTDLVICSDGFDPYEFAQIRWLIGLGLRQV